MLLSGDPDSSLFQRTLSKTPTSGVSTFYAGKLPGQYLCTDAVPIYSTNPLPLGSVPSPQRSSVHGKYLHCTKPILLGSVPCSYKSNPISACPDIQLLLADTHQGQIMISWGSSCDDNKLWLCSLRNVSVVIWLQFRLFAGSSWKCRWPGLATRSRRETSSTQRTLKSETVLQIFKSVNIPANLWKWSLMCPEWYVENLIQRS